MTAYIIVSYDIVDAKVHEGYVPGVVPLLQKHGAEILVAEYDAQALEGDKRNGCGLKKQTELAGAVDGVMPDRAASTARNDEE